jgi:N-methylhydantoinase A
VVGSAYVGSAKGCSDLLCVDMGGTSYDMALVTGGSAPAEAGWNMHHRNLIGEPMVKVETLGAGGGSICHVRSGEVMVGPRSAGAAPGPICYGRGGTEPTVTDALVMLGILSTEASFAGGSFRLSRAGVGEAFAALGAQMGYGAEDAAFDCWRVVNANMSQGVRRTTAGKGIDPKDLVMLAYGGNGPAFAAIQAEDLGIERILIPRASPTFSALGTLVADPVIDEERSYSAKATQIDPARMKALWAQLCDRAQRYFADAGYDAFAVEADYQLNMRYAGQNFALNFDIRTGGKLHDLDFVDAGLGIRAIELFNHRHMAEYNHIRADETPEIVGVRLASRVRTPSPQVSGGFTTPSHSPAPASVRRANLGRGYEDTPIHAGPSLVPGAVVPGPAIIEETFTTIVVYPGWKAMVDDAGDYELIR